MLYIQPGRDSKKVKHTKNYNGHWVITPKQLSGFSTKHEIKYIITNIGKVQEQLLDMMINKFCYTWWGVSWVNLCNLQQKEEISQSEFIEYISNTENKENSDSQDAFEGLGSQSNENDKTGIFDNFFLITNFYVLKLWLTLIKIFGGGILTED